MVFILIFRKSWYKSNVGANPSFEELIKQTTKNNAGRQTSKRLAVLNKLLMKNITDLMATGENSDKLVGFGLEISKVYNFNFNCIHLSLVILSNILGNDNIFTSVSIIHYIHFSNVTF